MALTLDPDTEQRIQRELDRGPFTQPADLLAHALDLVEAERTPTDWLFQNRDEIRAAIEESYAAREAGLSYSPEESRSMLEKRRAERKARAA